jgi:hypothetical protein
MTFVMVSLFFLAAVRVLYLISPSLLNETAILCADFRRNGRDVLKAALWWAMALAAIAALTLLF